MFPPLSECTDSVLPNIGLHSGESIHEPASPMSEAACTDPLAPILEGLISNIESGVATELENEIIAKIRGYVD